MLPGQPPKETLLQLWRHCLAHKGGVHWRFQSICWSQHNWLESLCPICSPPNLNKLFLHRMVHPFGLSIVVGVNWAAVGELWQCDTVLLLGDLRGEVLTPIEV